MTRLANDSGLREELGRNAREFWQAHHTMGCAVEDYEAVIGRALARPVPRVRDLPAHLLDEAQGLARTILSEFGMDPDPFR